MSKDIIPLADLAASFQLFNKTTGKSPRTVEWYDTRLELYGRFVGPDARLRDVTIERVRAYIVYLQERTQRHCNNPHMRPKDGPLSSAYIQGCVRGLRAFASWLYAEGYTETNRLQPLKPPKIQKKVIPVLSDDEMRKLLGIFNTDDAFGVRNQAIIWVFLDCGLRASELCNLQLADVHLRQGYLKVLGKGNKERLVPFGTGAQAALLRWRDQARPEFEAESAPSESFFLNANGDGLGLQALEEIVKRSGIRAGIPRVTCHLLRHSFATAYLVKEVGDSLRLQQILGHTSLEMVRHYVAMANIQQSLIERRASAMDVVLQGPPKSTQRRSHQPKRPSDSSPRARSWNSQRADHGEA
ncbi:MAG: tyrosine-type recombinase/integrase [Dehalococcoidia bacterium]|nr:tyrosine-type recombinase/integrase [Dehalococcoidia bacterium]